MQLIDLETFLAVAQYGSFSRAAVSLNVTQPAVTKRVQNLEASLETQLFDRVGKRIYLTDGGKLLIPRARALIRNMTDTRRLLQNLSQRVDGPLRLATSHHVGLHRLAPALKVFSSQHRSVKLDIRFEDSEVAHELVRRADTELAVVTLNPEGGSDLDYRPLWDDPLCFVASADHPLAGASSLSLEELARHPAILPGMSTYTGRIVAGLFESEGIELNSTLSTNFLETISMLVGIGLGWSVLPASMVGVNLIRLTTRSPDMHRTLGCVTNPRRTQSNAARAFIEVLRQLADPTDALHAPVEISSRSVHDVGATDP